MGLLNVFWVVHISAFVLKGTASENENSNVDFHWTAVLLPLTDHIKGGGGGAAEAVVLLIVVVMMMVVPFSLLTKIL